MAKRRYTRRGYPATALLHRRESHNSHKHYIRLRRSSLTDPATADLLKN